MITMFVIENNQIILTNAGILFSLFLALMAS